MIKNIGTVAGFGGEFKKTCSGGTGPDSVKKGTRRPPARVNDLGGKQVDPGGTKVDLTGIWVDLEAKVNGRGPNQDGLPAPGGQVPVQLKKGVGMTVGIGR